MLLRKLPALAAGLLLLSACILPRDFHAELLLKPDGGYSFALEGEVVYLPALAEQANPARDAAELQAFDRAFLSELSAIEGLSLLGPGRAGGYRVALKEEGRFAGSAWLPRAMPILRLERKEGGVSLTTEPFDPALKQELKRLGIAAAGTLCVTLVTGRGAEGRHCHPLHLDEVTAQRLEVAPLPAPLIARAGTE